ncbi:hypothetical protein [Rhodoferax sp. TS-BS-61-7]|uniref:hypothetical protein n=1 Tax=Rhodoferax sp. TS-BS-61-7 TaxID=2094194 RepID=UPI000CF63A0F|nr:hypothetical protein [Rhodoferax sp. TS-BS-61-7]PQA76033.1 hypothetical protein C5F53_18435 [Rhodoferax sp. TS-BS-61-7]
MSISPFFQHLRSAYEAEIDDLASDSEGKHMLPKKLAERRKELGFLLSMLELSPEMVAVVFHQAFRFKSTTAMNHLISHESEDLPDWDSLSDTVEVLPAARTMVSQVLQQPAGAWFMSVAAALEYMYGRPDSRAAAHSDEDDEEHEDSDDDTREDEGLDEDEREARVSEKEGAAWMVEQGFDHKD